MSAETPNADRASQVAAFLAAPLPRTVPEVVRRAAIKQSVPGALIVLGCLFFLMGSFFLWVFFPWNFYQEIRLNAADTAMANGRVIAAAPTSMSVNRTRVIGYRFEFHTAGGVRADGECYTTGARWRAGNSVRVRYRPEAPLVCCIEGARLNPAGWAAAGVSIFPLLGAALIIWPAIARRRMARLLKNGFLAEALVTGVEQTLMRVNNRYVHKIALQRTDSPEAGTFTVRQTVPEVIAFARERMAASQPVYVLYDPAKPKRAILPETFAL